MCLLSIIVGNNNVNIAYKGKEIILILKEELAVMLITEHMTDTTNSAIMTMATAPTVSKEEILA